MKFRRAKVMGDGEGEEPMVLRTEMPGFGLTEALRDRFEAEMCDDLTSDKLGLMVEDEEGGTTLYPWHRVLWCEVVV